MGETICDCPVIGGFEDRERHRGKYNSTFVAFGDNERRRDLMKALEKSGNIISILIIPLTNICKYSRISEVSIIFPFVSYRSK